ncbi:energy transducer TonB [Paraburkholderia ribeironis]|nr:energy transducer TonB [Paraburkholderia ribeironis]
MISATRYRRVLLVLGAVIGAHLALLVVTLATRDRTVERPVEPPTITAVLLSPEPQPPIPAAPAAVVPPTPPAAAHPVVRARPVPQPQPSPHVTHSVQTPAQTPAQIAPTAPVAPAQHVAPSPTAQPAPVAAPPMPAAPATASAPAVERTVPASTAPKNVSHVDCTIPKPDYPDISRRRGENGTTVVRFVVGLTGRIETVQLQTSSGSQRLDDAALAAVHGGVCQPYSENGAAIRAACSQSFVFGMSD